jgi:hypothetical protein
MHNIIASFLDMDALRSAIARLQQQEAVPMNRMHLKASHDTEFLARSGPSQPRPGQPGYQEQGVLESFGSFWANLLESHTDESGIYAETLRRGSSLLMVEADTDEEAARLRRLLRDCGAQDIEEGAAAWRAQGWDAPR